MGGGVSERRNIVVTERDWGGDTQKREIKRSQMPKEKKKRCTPFLDFSFFSPSI